MAQTFFFPFLAFGWQMVYGLVAAAGFRLYNHFHPAPEETDNELQQTGIENKAYLS